MKLDVGNVLEEQANTTVKFGCFSGTLSSNSAGDAILMESSLGQNNDIPTGKWPSLHTRTCPWPMLKIPAAAKHMHIILFRSTENLEDLDANVFSY